MTTPTPCARIDAARAVVLPGTGAAVRLPGLLCLLHQPAEDGGDAGPGHLARLVEILTENAAANPTTPGRPLARRLARWLGSLDPGPDFGTIAATESGVAIFLHGAVDAVIGGQRYSAVDSGAWLDRLLMYPVGPLVLVPTDRPAPDNTPRGVYDLRGGVVPAGAVLLVARSGTLPSALATPCAIPGEAAGTDPPPAASAAVESTAEAPVPDVPRAAGTHMDEQTGIIEIGLRKPLGLLVFDDGSTVTVDGDYLLGRMPEADPRVVGGQLRPLPVDDPQAQLSRGHLVIKLDGSDVTAIDESRNGTLVAFASEDAWSRLTPRQPLRLLPGTRVRVGGRCFVFESPSGVR